MAERHTSSRAVPSGASRTRGGISSASTQSVRRNLFPSHLTRRQPAVSPPPEEPSHFDAGLPREQHQHYHPGGGSHRHRHNGSFRTSSPSDIVVRDHNGEIELGDPPSPIVDVAEDAEAAEERHELEMERQRLAEALRQHRMGQHGVSPHPEEELLEAVKASLRAKVAALEEDKWLYEPELPQRHQ
ncbi:hypothetical protein VTJ83DRAFT_1896 [Remersonia thermophila]|uniref:Uncharacterized protein n=1 Tax=Remersonia thermophila TaxID=72144 RepID=A0ABR4DHI5_9PEZI